METFPNMKPGWWFQPSKKNIKSLGRIIFHFHVLQGSPCSVLHFGLELLCAEEGSAIIIRLDNIFLNKIIRNQVLELSGKLLSRRHFESSLDKICYRLCNGPV